MLLIIGVFVLCKMLTWREVGWRAYEHPILYLQVFHNLKLLFKNKSFERCFLHICWAKDPESKKDKRPVDSLEFLLTEALLRYHKFSLFFGYVSSLYLYRPNPWRQKWKYDHALKVFIHQQWNTPKECRNKSDYCFNLLKHQDKKRNCYCISEPWLLRKLKELE